MIENIQIPKKTNLVVNSFDNSVSAGRLNSLKNITQQQFITINSKYRNTPLTSTSTDFQINFPAGEIKKVVAVKLASIQFPEKGYYMFSDFLRNNIFFMQIYFCANEPPVETHIIRIPDGNFYSIAEFVSFMNTTFFYLSECVLTPFFKDIVFSIDTITYRAEFINKNTTITIGCVFYDPSLNTNHENTFGWQLGFRLPIYMFNHLLISECMSNIFVSDRNVFISVNDYQYNNNNNNLVLLGSTMLDDYILGQYTLNSKNDHNNNTLPLVSFPRLYNGPVNLKKLGFKVYNEDGNIIDLNGLEISITLELTILYENFNFL